MTIDYTGLMSYVSLNRDKQCDFTLFCSSPVWNFVTFLVIKREIRSNKKSYKFIHTPERGSENMKRGRGKSIFSERRNIWFYNAYTRIITY